MTTPSIPASAFVSVNPGVIGTGGNALALNGLFLTTNSRVPIGTFQSFASAANVGSYFGLSSAEYAAAQVYFSGYTTSTAKPAAMLFTQYNTAAVPAYLRGGNVSTLTTAQIEALSGTIKILVNGTVQTSSAINLSSSGTLSLAAAAIQSAFSSFLGTVTYDSVSGGFIFQTTATGSSETISYIYSNDGTASACTTSGTVLTVGGTVANSFNVGDIVTGTDGTNALPSGCTIVNQLTGTTGGAGTYTISAAASPGNMSSAAVTGYSFQGNFAKTLGLTQATGAVLSQGAATAVPNTFMSALVTQTTAWATFTTLFDPDGGSGNTQKQAFAAWNTLQNNRYMYVAWDTDITPTQSTNAAASLGQILIGNGNAGTALVYEPSDLHLASFLMGAVASINFTQPNGNTALAYKSQSGITPAVSNQTVMTNLIANSYNTYVAAANATNNWQFFYPQTVTGPFLTIQRYVNQIWLNAGFQTSLVTLLTTVPAVPYVQAGYALIEAALLSNVQAALAFGMIQPGVNLSALQVAEVNAQAGRNIANTLQTQGYYIQVLDPGAVVRGQNGSPVVNFWYTDGGSVLQINMASTDVE